MAEEKKGQKERLRVWSPVVEPSILSTDFTRLGEHISRMVDAGLKVLHIDVMDGHFVPNLSMGPQVLSSLKKRFPGIVYSVHLMVERPEHFVEPFVRAGGNIITVHQEATYHLDRLLRMIKGYGVLAGVSINPATPLDTIRHVLHLADVVLVMTVNPGFGGQSLIEYALEKVAALNVLREDMGYDYLIEVDGGIKHEILPKIVRLGADLIVMGSAIMGAEDPAEAFRDAMGRLGLHTG